MSRDINCDFTVCDRNLQRVVIQNVIDTEISAVKIGMVENTTLFPPKSLNLFHTSHDNHIRFAAY